MHWLHLLGLCLAALALAGSVYALISAGAVVRLLRRPPLHAPSLPPVTLLKPLHGAEPLLTQNLESFLAQDYPAPVQVIFGVQNAADPAIATVRALQAKYPERDLDLVIDAHLSGTNRKISNLVNMFPAPGTMRWSCRTATFLSRPIGCAPLSLLWPSPA